MFRAIGRILFASIFISAGGSHLNEFISQPEALSKTAGLVSHGLQQLALDAAVPYAKELVAIGGLLSVLGGLAVIAGGERCGGAMLLLFLAPVSVVMHNFWSGPELDKDHMAHFLKNVALMGASLVLLFPHSSASASGKVKQQ